MSYYRFAIPLTLIIFVGLLAASGFVIARANCYTVTGI